MAAAEGTTLQAGGTANFSDEVLLDGSATLDPTASKGLSAGFSKSQLRNSHYSVHFIPTLPSYLKCFLSMDHENFDF